MLERARRLTTGPQRRILGIAGGPGAGKSTLAAALGERLDPRRVAVVGMDGWHLANSTLARLGRLERKGAPDTFDAAGYVAFLERFLTTTDTLWAPEYRRGVDGASGATGFVDGASGATGFVDGASGATGFVDGASGATGFSEESIGGALEIGPEVRLLITEGNYLLLDEPPWDRVRPLLDEAWFVDPGETVRRDRLIARHERVGRTREAAVARADGPDAANATRIAATAHRADVTVTDDAADPPPPPGDDGRGS